MAVTADIVIPKSGTDIKFTYLVPEELELEAKIGKSVLVPLKNRTAYGFIYRMSQINGINDIVDRNYLNPEKNKKINLKKIFRISKPIFFDESRKDIFNFLSSYYHESVSKVFETVLPSIDVKHFDLLDKYYEEAMSMEPGRIGRIGGIAPAPAGRRKERPNEGGNETDINATTISGANRNREEIGFCNGNADGDGRNGSRGFLSDAPYRLTEGQEDAVNLIKEAMSEDLYKTFLLHGVTASGKTEIYFRLLDYALSLNRQVIITVPEIFITNQFIHLIKKRFAMLVEQNGFAVFHSKISKKEKLINHIRIMNGGVRLILGARSAIFSPLKNHGLIIIDEEHDSSYKQQAGLLYNARDVAVMISKKNSSVCILGSATPSLESYYNATIIKKYEYIYIKDRVKGKSLPEVDIIDLRREFQNSGKHKLFKDKILSDETALLIEENLKNKKQILLFLNRRGFSTFLICTSCGHLFLCKNCAISLVYHRHKDKDEGQGLLECHYCGYKEEVPKLCPECGADTIEPYGIGVQKLEDAVKSLFGGSGARIERIDSDTAKNKKTGLEIFKKMHKKEIDILVGTQIITKGHDFPDVGLVAVIFADSLLNIPDFRSAEKAFQVLTQVIGRAGRGEDRGKIAIQTFLPDNYLLKYTASHDIKGFYEKELNIRKEYGYPPYAKIIALKLIGKNLKDLEENALNIKKIICEIIAGPVKYNNNNSKRNYNDNSKITVLGPSPCLVEKIKNNFRYMIILKSPPPASSLHRLAEALRQNGHLSKLFSGGNIVIDVDPGVLM